MKRKIITTADGSKTIQIEEWNEQYHSIHGAIQEARHVFIKHGLLFYSENRQHIDHIGILEMGFGTGLNAFLTYVEAEALSVKINYTGVEAYPVEADEILQLNYPQLISSAHKNVFDQMHQATWEHPVVLNDHFTLQKQQQFFDTIDDQNAFDIIYFDAFGARVQPELWTEDIFFRMFSALRPGGVLVTYSAKGSVRRAMEAVGFTVERLPGPPGKREMLRAVKA
ncbi:MAG: tRNA (5-methylaminomethyl-2-thiouridine)(34)-methyltransferase MnmD [Bacteroidota bacterium]